MLLLLAAYQILEIIICTVSQKNIFLLQMAFITVAWLPPTGILLVAQLYPSKRHAVYWYARSMFALALVIVLWIFIDKSFVSESVCTVVFVRYFNPMPKYLIYCGFYWLGLLSMILLSAHGINISRDHKQRRLLWQVLVGSLAFIIPSLITVLIIPPTKGASPSIMCHYALLMAIFIIKLIYLERRINNSTTDKVR